MVTSNYTVVFITTVKEFIVLELVCFEENLFEMKFVTKEEIGQS
jgi:hypothetical protein